MPSRLVFTIPFALAVGLFTAGTTSGAIQIYLSPQDETDIGPVDAPVNHHDTPFGNGSTNVWVRNLDDDPANDEMITSVGLNVVSMDPGVIKFTDVLIHNPHIDSGTAQDDRWQQTSKGTISPNLIDDFWADIVSTGFGMDPSLAGVDPL